MSIKINKCRFDGGAVVRVFFAFSSAFVILATLGSWSESSLTAQDSRPEKLKPDNEDGQAEKKQAAHSRPTEFLRLTQDESGTSQAMQTAITRYRPNKGKIVVDLIAAVHIGEGDYYDQLNTQFELYDVVLYELVAPQGTRVPRGGKNPNGQQGMIGWIQEKAQKTLGLESQLEKIDYQKSNFTHADMSPAEIGEKMAERGESPLTVGLSAFSELLRQQNKVASSLKNDGGDGGAKSLTSDSLASENMLDLLGDPLKMKQLMARQFAQSGAMEFGLGETLNQMLITDRNAAAIKVMQQEIARGKRKIAIFYGAAHMPDFEKRLVGKFGMKKTKQIWVDAWDLSQAPEAAPADSTSSLLLKVLEGLGGK